MKKLLICLLATFGAQMVVLLFLFVTFDPESLTEGQVIISILAATIFTNELMEK